MTRGMPERRPNLIQVPCVYCGKLPGEHVLGTCPEEMQMKVQVGQIVRLSENEWAEIIHVTPSEVLYRKVARTSLLSDSLPAFYESTRPRRPA